MATHNESMPVVHESRTGITLVRPSSRVVLIGLLGVSGALLLVDVASRFAGGGLIARFSLGGQSTIATWWASVQLLLLAVLAGVVAIREQTDGCRRAAWALRIGAGVAVVLSLEEVAALGQSIPAGLLRSGLVSTIDAASDTLSVVVLAVAFVLAALALPGIVDLLKRRRTNTLLVLFGGLLMLGGGAAFDAAGILEPSHTKAVIEDLFQFLGIAVVLWATYRMLGSHEIRIRRR